MLHDQLEQYQVPTRVEVFVRSLAPDTARQQQDDLIQRLQTLEANADIGTLDLYVTGDCVCESTATADTETGQFLLDRFEQFNSWADENGVTLLGFQNRCVDSTLNGTTVTGYQFPRVSAALFADGELIFVGPCSDRGTQYSIPELVMALESSAAATGDPDSTA